MRRRDPMIRRGEEGRGKYSQKSHHGIPIHRSSGFNVRFRFDSNSSRNDWRDWPVLALLVPFNHYGIRHSAKQAQGWVARVATPRHHRTERG